MYDSVFGDILEERAGRWRFKNIHRSCIGGRTRSTCAKRIQGLPAFATHLCSDFVRCDPRDGPILDTLTDVAASLLCQSHNFLAHPIASQWIWEYEQRHLLKLMAMPLHSTQWLCLGAQTKYPKHLLSASDRRRVGRHLQALAEGDATRSRMTVLAKSFFCARHPNERRVKMYVDRWTAEIEVDSDMEDSDDEESEEEESEEDKGEILQDILAQQDRVIRAIQPFMRAAPRVVPMPTTPPQQKTLSAKLSPSSDSSLSPGTHHPVYTPKGNSKYSSPITPFSDYRRYSEPRVSPCANVSDWLSNRLTIHDRTPSPIESSVRESKKKGIAAAKDGINHIVVVDEAPNPQQATASTDLNVSEHNIFITTTASLSSIESFTPVFTFSLPEEGCKGYRKRIRTARELFNNPPRIPSAEYLHSVFGNPKSNAAAPSESGISTPVSTSRAIESGRKSTDAGDEVGSQPHKSSLAKDSGLVVTNEPGVSADPEPLVDGVADIPNPLIIPRSSLDDSPMPDLYQGSNAQFSEEQTPTLSLFSKYGVAMDAAAIDDSILRSLGKRPQPGRKTPRSKIPGIVYILRHPGHQQYLKIGKTRVSIAQRLNEVSRCYGNAMNLVDDSLRMAFLNYDLAEKLIHLELHNYRRHYSCPEHGKERHHNEWFEVEEEKALEIVQRWRRWLEKTPYSETGQLEQWWMEKPLHWGTDGVTAATHDNCSDRWALWLSPRTPREDFDYKVSKYLFEPRTDRACRWDNIQRLKGFLACCVCIWLVYVSQGLPSALLFTIFIAVMV